MLWATHQILYAPDVKNTLTLSVILSLASTSLEILLLNWTKKRPFWRPGTPFYTIMKTLIYNSANFVIVALDKYGRAFGLSATPVGLLVLGINTPP